MDLRKEKINKAVTALFTLLEKDKKSKFIEEAEKINLQFTFKKVPRVKNKLIHLRLPHSMQRSNQDVCLFVKDLDRKQRDYDPTVRHYKELLESHDISVVSEVIPLKSLKIEYKPYEAKRVLSDRFDVFLADKCIIRLLPDLLGKAFYSKKRIPIGVNMNAKQLKKEIDKALDNSRCVITGRGSSCMASVAHSEMTAESVAENVIASANQIARDIPGGPNNIKCMYIKTMYSMSIPIYISSDEGDVVLPVKEKQVADTEPEEITSLMGGKVKVSKFGDVEVLIAKRVAEDDDLELDSFTERKKFKPSKTKKLKASFRTVKKQSLKKSGLKRVPTRKKPVKAKS